MAKFLMISKRRAVPQRTESQQDPIAFFRACKENLNTMLDDGTLDCAYVFTDGNACCIMNVESHEELFRRKNAFPGSRFLEWDIYPLMDHNFFYDTIIEGMKSRADG